MVLVKKDKNERTRFQRECLLDMFHGNVDEQKRSPLTIEDVGTLPSGKVPRRILIEGQPGIGKTTFAWDLCRKWAKGKALRNWDHVILLRMRDRRVRQAKSLSDLFFHAEAETREAICQEIVRKRGEGVLMLFEGYDELSQEPTRRIINISTVVEERHSS